jgi:hypothetical protein
MFWIALSALIMNLTGEGDDTHAFRKLLERLREAIEERVQEPARRKAGLQTIDQASNAFVKHRERFAKIGTCIERADRSYTASREDYERCFVDVEPAWKAAAEDLIRLDRGLHSSLTPAELAAVQRAGGQ